MGKLKTISMLDLRQRAETIINEVRRGQTMVLTYRGRAAVRLEPIRPETVAQDDPFYGLSDLADARGRSLSNDEIDDIVYGP